MIEIIPAIIPKKFKDLERDLGLVLDLVPLCQIDVMDGKFTPEASWPYVNFQEDPDFISIKKEEKEFPFLEEIDFEVDLMVKNPENVWFDWIIAGAKRIIFHYESTDKLAELLENCRQKLVAKESVLYVEIGLAIDINTPNDKIYTRNDVLRWGTPRCFQEEHLYSARFGKHVSDVIERRFFGKIDDIGSVSLPSIANYKIENGLHQAWRGFMHFIGAQKQRTPKTLDLLALALASNGIKPTQNNVMRAMHESLLIGEMASRVRKAKVIVVERA